MSAEILAFPSGGTSDRAGGSPDRPDRAGGSPEAEVPGGRLRAGASQIPQARAIRAQVISLRRD